MKNSKEGASRQAEKDTWQKNLSECVTTRIPDPTGAGKEIKKKYNRTKSQLEEAKKTKGTLKEKTNMNVKRIMGHAKPGKPVL